MRYGSGLHPAGMVALLAEGVDRNSLCLLVTRFHQRSPSSRRAWIEILAELQNIMMRAVALLAEGVDRNLSLCPRPRIVFVALLAEGVDRNICHFGFVYLVKRSPSSRRAWIEIIVAAVRTCLYVGRPPRGGRG